MLEYQRLEKRARERSGYDDAGRRSDEASDALCDAYIALINTPAPDISALRWKLEYLFADGDGSKGAADEDGYSPSYHTQYIGAVLADARRLPGEA